MSKKIILIITLSLLVLTSGNQVFGAGISGTIYISPELRHKASPKDTVYIVAQAKNGPKQPLAIKNTTVDKLPAEFTLSDGDAMTPGLKLSSYGEVRIISWVSKTGMAYLSAGDMVGITDNVRTDGSYIKVIINRITR